jgi:mannosidase alpha-like ER degradation enhancer 1
MGGLLSAHTLALETRNRVADYDGALLRLAVDLGERLLPAFASATRIPYAWVNLRHGVRQGETEETNTAACGSLVLELGQVRARDGSSPVCFFLRVNQRAYIWRSSFNMEPLST